MERRQFLALGGSALLAGCGGGGGFPSPAPSPAPAPAPAPAPSGPDWDALGRQMQGQVLRPGSADFDRVRRGANARYDAQAPLAIARCTSAADVAAALTFAQQQKAAFTARSGGHS